MDHKSFPENNPALRSFLDIPTNHSFPIQNLPFGIFITDNNKNPRAGVAIGDWVLDLSALADNHIFKDTQYLKDTQLFKQDALNAFIALGQPAWREARALISRLLRHDEALLRDNKNLQATALIPSHKVSMLLPIRVGQYTDFYSSKEHARNVGMMFRDKDNPLLPNWVHIPVAYDGRASTIVVSGTDFHRPMGQIKPAVADNPIFDESQQLDVEVEVAFIIGKGNTMGEPISVNKAPEHIFGMVLLADWSARDIQKWEYVPLGPFLSKNFCTSISPWVVTLDALEPFRQANCEQSPAPLPYLQSSRDWAYDIQLGLSLQTSKMQAPKQIALTNYKGIYWDFCQQLAHHTVNGCKMNVGDIFASGTISGDRPDSCGSLLEITWAGANPVALEGGETRTFLLDGDKVSIDGWCQGHDYRIGFGEVNARILPSLKAK